MIIYYIHLTNHNRNRKTLAFIIIHYIFFATIANEMTSYSLYNAEPKF